MGAKFAPCGEIKQEWSIWARIDKKEHAMQIVAKNTKDLKPYENNPRKNDEAAW